MFKVAKKDPGNWRNYSSPLHRVAKDLHQVAQTKHLDYSATEQKNPEDDTMDCYHDGELPTSLADRIKLQGFSLITHNPSYTIGKLLFFFDTF